MVSIISRWLQKRMPSYGEIESKVTREQIEDNKDITSTFKFNVFSFIVLCLQLYAVIYMDFLGKVLIFPTILALLINGLTILFSIALSKRITILKYKINMAMVAVSAMVFELNAFCILIYFESSILIKMIMVVVIIISVKLLILNDTIKTTKYDWVITCGSIFCFLTAVWELFLGKSDLYTLIKPILLIVILIIFLKIALNASDLHFKTLFYVLTYPEEFRRKFGYSVKEWYGKRSPQYRKEKKLNQ